MKKIYNRTLLLLAITIGSIVGIIKGSEAKQKWMFKIKIRNEEKRQQAQQKKMLKDGSVELDDIEIAAYHKS
ncbi:hypothetical protein ACX0G7_04300 [Flavitalea antarctica]